MTAARDFGTVHTYYRLKNLPFWWRTQPDGICSNRKTTGISVSIYYIRKLSLILKKTQRGRSRKSQRGQIVLIIKTQRGRSRKSQRGQIVLIIKKKKKKKPKEVDHVNPKEVRSYLNPIEVENFSEQGNRSPWLPNYTEQGKSLLGVFQENSKPGGHKALTKDFSREQGNQSP